MIRLTLLQALTLYVIVFLAGIAAVWIFYVLQRWRHDRRRLRGRVTCRFCATVFEDPSPDVLTRCPACGSLNEKFKQERI